MSTSNQTSVLDVRSLPGTRESIAYKDGGLFPVLSLAPGGVVVAVLRGGAGHLGLEGRIEIIRSLDNGRSWTPPNVIADSDRDDRNPGFGVTREGTLILSYHRQGSYDEAGNYRPVPRSVDAERPIEAMVTRSLDAGLTWEKPFPLGVDLLRPGSPFGKIVQLADGTLLMAVYYNAISAIVGDRLSQVSPAGSCSYLVRSHDDGKSWGEPALIGVNVNETALLALPAGDVIAVMRDDTDQALHCTHSADGGATWTQPKQVTAPRQHPADLLRLSNGDILLVYGNRQPPYRIEGLVSHDGGQSWAPTLLTFSGHLYGYNVTGPRPTDLGYPSSVVQNGKGVTMYYYNPSLTQPFKVNQRENEARYLARDYYAIAVTWDEQELIDAIRRTAP